MIENIKRHQNYISICIALLSLCYIVYVVSIRGKSFVEASFNLNNLSLLDISLLSISLLILSTLNWFSESVKWHILINNYKKFSFNHSIKRCLAGHAIGIMTPNKLGDYAAKMYLYPGVTKKNILVANFLNNAYQLLVTLFFGSVGLFLFYKKVDMANYFNLEVNHLWTYIILVSVFLLTLIFFKKKIVHFLTKVNINKKNNGYILLLSITKYIAFSQLYVILLKLLGTDIPLFQLMYAAWVMYLISSIVPTFFISDLVVKTGVAVLIFTSLGVNEVNVIIASFLTWIFNFIIPALVGNVFMLQLKRKTKKEKIIS